MTDRFKEALDGIEHVLHPDTFASASEIAATFTDHWDTIRTSLSAAGGVPEGWKLVPCEPVDSQFDAAERQIGNIEPLRTYKSNSTQTLYDIYTAMVDAAPTAEKGQGDSDEPLTERERNIRATKMVELIAKNPKPPFTIEDPRDLAIRDMAEALRFYADRENHRDVGEIGLNNIFADGGNKADAALSKHAAQIKRAEGG